MRRFVSMDPVGILKAWTENVRMKRARMTATAIDSRYSRAVDFLKGVSAASEPSFMATILPCVLQSTRSTARKASWGMSTRPTRFMRFFPSFCFSRSFLFRVMSPP